MKEVLDGWGSIAQRLSICAGFNISIAQAKRYESRNMDPLPIRRVGRGMRQRVIADAAEVDAWAIREYEIRATRTM